MDHKSFLIQLQSRLGKDKEEIDSTSIFPFGKSYVCISSNFEGTLFSDGHCGNTRIRVIRAQKEIGTSSRESVNR